MLDNYFVCVVSICLWGHWCNGATKTNFHNVLMKDLFTNYDATVIPRVNLSDTIDVTHVVEIMAVLDVNERGQIVEISCFVTQNWTDQFLTWDPTKYGNVKKIYVDNEKVWKPLTFMGVNIELDPVQSERQSFVMLTANAGRPGLNETLVTMQFLGIYKISCKMNVKLFPWDSQTCFFPFYSLAYTQDIVRYLPSSIPPITINFLSNGGWDLINLTSVAESDYYDPATNGIYGQLMYTLEIKRKPMYYIVNLLAPCVVINLICLVGLFTSSGVEHGDKITLGLTGLLSLSVYLLIVNGDMPATSDCIPLMTLFFMVNFVFLTVAMASSVAVAQLSKNGHENKPLGKVATAFHKKFVFRSEVHDISTTQKQGNHYGMANVPTTRNEWYAISQAVEKILLSVFLSTAIIATMLFIIIGYNIS